MVLIGSVIVALITGACSIVVAIISSRNTREALLQELKLQQAVQNERVENYQRTTNEKIDNLTQQVSAQSVYGTRLALLESWKEQVERRLNA